MDFTSFASQFKTIFCFCSADTFEGRYILKYVRKTERGTNEDATIDKTAVGLIRTLLDQLVIPDEYLLKSYSEGSK